VRWAPDLCVGIDVACSIGGGPVGGIPISTPISGMMASGIRPGRVSPGVLSGGDLQPQAARPPKRFFASVMPFLSTDRQRHKVFFHDPCLYTKFSYINVVQTFQASCAPSTLEKSD
jgi:hypothetical protein